MYALPILDEIDMETLFSTQNIDTHKGFLATLQDILRITKHHKVVESAVKIFEKLESLPATQREAAEIMTKLSKDLLKSFQDNLEDYLNGIIINY